MSELTVADYLLQRLREWDVRHVFAYPGDGINAILAAWGRAEDRPAFVQARHEEMCAFEAVGYAKFSGRVGVCMATSGPGAIHLLNGLYDAKLDHVPVVAVVGQTNRSAMGGSYQQEVDLASLFKDVASAYVQTVNVPEQLPNVVDRAIRTALAQRTPTALIIPADVQELPYSAPTHEFKMVPSSLGVDWPAIAPDDAAIARAAEVLNAGDRVAMLVGTGAHDARQEVAEVADLLGAGAAKALLGKDVLSDELPWVTGSIGLLGTRPSYEMMRDCDTVLTIGSSFPYSQFMPEFGQARGVQIDIDPTMIGMRYPYEVNLVADAKTALRALIPHLHRKADRSWREGIEKNVGRWWETMRMQADVSADPVNPLRLFAELSDQLPENAVVTADSGSAANWYARQLKFRGNVRGSLGHPGHHGPRRALRDRREVRPPGPPGDRVRRRRRHADERHGRAHHHQALPPAMVRPAPDRRRPAQQRPQPGHLGAASHGRCPEIHRFPDTSRRRLRGVRREPGVGRDDRHRPRRPRRRLAHGSGGRPPHGARRPHRSRHASDPAARHVGAVQVDRRGRTRR